MKGRSTAEEEENSEAYRQPYVFQGSQTLCDVFKKIPSLLLSVSSSRRSQTEPEDSQLPTINLPTLPYYSEYLQTSPITHPTHQFQSRILPLSTKQNKTYLQSPSQISNKSTTMRSQTLLLLPFLLTAPTLASNIHNNNNHLARQDMTIQTDTTANNGFITGTTTQTQLPISTVTTTDSNGDPRTLTWFTVPSDGPATTATVTSSVSGSGSGSVTVTSTGSGAGAGEGAGEGGEATSTSSSTAGGARVTGGVGVVGMGVMGVGAMGVVVGLVGL